MGRISRAHGLEGAVVVDVETDRPRDRFQVGARLLLEDGSTLTVARFEETDRSPLVTFVEIHDRATAISYRGRSLYVEASARRDLDPDEFWPDELVGMDVFARDGGRVGVVLDVEIGGAQDRLVIDSGQGPVLVPFVTALIPEVDLEKRRVVVDLPPGFTD